MEVILGKTAGFCYGVKRAITKAEEQTKKNKDLYCLGEIVHNKRVVEDLKNKKIKFIDNIEDSKGKTIIRAHGVAKNVYKYAKDNNIELYDYTCPNVLSIHTFVKEYEKKGYYIFLLGKSNHPENIGTISYCGKNSSIIEDIDDISKSIEDFNKSKIKKLFVIAQTTFSIEKFKRIEKILTEKVDKDIKLVIKNTICKATEVRQKETEQLSKKVDYMIIIGGSNSSNTRKLYDIANKNCHKAISIEDASELDDNDFSNIKTVGVMAGASTPDILIKEVIDKLKA